MPECHHDPEEGHRVGITAAAGRAERPRDHYGGGEATTYLKIHRPITCTPVEVARASPAVSSRCSAMTRFGRPTEPGGAIQPQGRSRRLAVVRRTTQESCRQGTRAAPRRRSGMKGWGVDIRPVPELELDQRPEPPRMVMSLVMFHEHARDGLRPE